ncbi:MAG: oligoendopeptidase F [Acidobacteria bacterium]|uniref:Oligopeptidase F n=1 Tax=Candidatus Polarisedimenticola svalbardensis TaxID=2886004 RepID=A0A8J7C261_9BACT|nr:oligoendopeptidase F [Candidatus Polarisedimenticola svalbardensis]
MKHRTMTLLAVLIAILGFAPAFSAPLPVHQPDATVQRGQVPDAYKWDLTALYANDEEWAQSQAALDSHIFYLGAFKGELKDPEKLEKCLNLYFKYHLEANRGTLYANLKLATAQSDNDAQAMQQSSLTVLDELMTAASFIRSELLTLSPAAMDKAYAARPGLATHKPYIENILRRRDRVLSPEAERVLSLAGDNLWAEIDLNEIPSPHEETFRNLLSNIPWPMVHDAAGNEVQLTLANLGRFRASPDRKVRKEAMTAFLASIRQYQNALAGTLTGQFKLDVAYARARNYDTALEAYLDKDGLNPAVFDNLIDTVNANLAPLHRYVELRKQALGVEDLHLYDLYVAMVPGLTVEVPIAEGRETLVAALAPLGDDYVGLVREGLDADNGWIDLYPHMDKESGAFSANVYGRHPFIKMNYQDSLDDLSTLAHEFGHAVHSSLTMEAQPYSSSRYVPFLAEIASTINEKFLSDYLVRNAKSDAMKAYVLTELAENIRTTIYRQTLFAEFEKTVHGFIEEGVPVTAALLDETYTGLVRRYYGEGFTVGPDDGMEWAYIPHFYYKYYVFSYATGLSSGIALADRIEQGGEAAVQDYLGMLKGGCFRPPLDLLKSAGVDLTEPAAVEAALKLFEKTVAELEKLL